MRKKKKQTALSHSTPESEIVALDAAFRMLGLPALALWEILLGRKPVLKLFEDNETTQRILRTGKFPTMRHVKRVHGIANMFLHETLVHRKMYELCDSTSAMQVLYQ